VIWRLHGWAAVDFPFLLGNDFRNIGERYDWPGINHDLQAVFSDKMWKMMRQYAAIVFGVIQNMKTISIAG
jgi:hypothetical protein